MRMCKKKIYVYHSFSPKYKSFRKFGGQCETFYGLRCFLCFYWGSECKWLCSVGFCSWKLCLTSGLRRSGESGG
ncbi:hypothetical protein Hdeb2414_s0007g00237991 [Helianthus debilis subsp. tardiflorus]